MAAISAAPIKVCRAFAAKGRYTTQWHQVAGVIHVGGGGQSRGQGVQQLMNAASTCMLLLHRTGLQIQDAAHNDVYHKGDYNGLCTFPPPGGPSSNVARPGFRMLLTLFRIVILRFSGRSSLNRTKMYCKVPLVE